MKGFYPHIDIATYERKIRRDLAEMNAAHQKKIDAGKADPIFSAVQNALSEVSVVAAISLAKLQNDQYDEEMVADALGAACGLIIASYVGSRDDVCYARAKAGFLRAVNDVLNPENGDDRSQHTTYAPTMPGSRA